MHIAVKYTCLRHIVTVMSECRCTQFDLMSPVTKVQQFYVVCNISINLYHQFI